MDKFRKILFLVLILTLFLVIGVNAQNVLTGCISYSDENYIDCSASYQGNTYNYIVGTPASFNAPEDIMFNVLYSANNHISEYFSLYFDSRLNTCLTPAGCTLINGDWTTICRDNGGGWYVCEPYYKGTLGSWFYMKSNGDAVFITYLTPGTNAPPAFGMTQNVSFNEDSGFQNNLIDLHALVADDRDSDSALTFAIIAQTNSPLTNCVIDSNRYVDCSAPALNQNGVNTITIRATDTLGASRNKDINIVVTSVNDAPTTPTSLTFNLGVYGKNNDTVNLHCSGSIDVDSVLYYNIESNISGVWDIISLNNPTGIFNFNISSYGSKNNVGFRCLATDLQLNSSYLTSPNTIDIDYTVPEVTNLIANNIEYGSNNEILVDVVDYTQIDNVILEVNGIFNYTMSLKAGNTYNYTFVNPSVGGYNLRIYAVDTLGNLNSSVVGDFTVNDTTNPSVFDLFYLGTVEYDNDVIITVNVTDINLNSVWIEINNSNTSMTHLSGNTYQINLSNLVVDSYPFMIYANDSYGNLNDSEIGTVNVVDTTNPVWSPLPVNQIINLTDYFVMQVNATDFRDLTYSIDDNFNFSINQNSGLIVNNTYLRVGVYPLQINVSDGINQNVTKINVTVQDILNPEVNLINYTDYVEFNSSFEVYVNIKDLDQINLILIELNSSVNQTMIYLDNNVYYYSFNPNIAENQSFRIYAQDRSLNINDSLIRYFNVSDETKPVISNVSFVSPVQYGDNFSISVEVFDLNLDDVWIEIDSSNESLYQISSQVFGLNNISLEVGEYNFTIYANDSYNNLNSSQIFSVQVIDNRSPDLNLISFDSYVEYGDNTSFVVNATDVSNIDNVWINLGNGSVYDMVDIGNDIYEFNLSKPNVFNYNFTIFSNDTIGNIANVSNLMIVDDRTNPVISLSSYNNSIDLGDNFVFKFNVTDLSLIDTVLVELDGINYSLSNLELTNLSDKEFIFNISNLGVGSYNFKIFANDSHNNSVLDDLNLFEIVDRENPLVEIISFNSSIEFNDNLTVVINVTDLNKINSAELILSNGSIYLMNNESQIDNNTIFNYTVRSPNVGNNQYFIINVTDISGNYNDSLIRYFNVTDLTKPEVLINYNSNVELGNDIQINVTATDLSLIDTVQVLINSSYYNLSQIGVSDNYTINLSGFEVEKYPFTIYVNDTFGNLNDSQTGIIVVNDTTKPEITNLLFNGLNNDSIEFNNNLTISVDVQDNGQIVNVWLELSNGSNYNMIDVGNNLTYNMIMLSPTVENYNFTIYANDSLNNTQSLNSSFVVTDLINPKVILLPFNNSVEFGDDVKINVTVTDLSSIDSVRILINSSYYNFSQIGVSDEYYINLSDFDVGTYLFTIYVNDTLGNLNDSISSSFDVVDTVIPQINNVSYNHFIEYDANLSIDINVSDLSGIDNVTVVFNGLSNIAVLKNSGNLSSVYNLTLNSPSVGNLNNFTVVVYDNNGLNNSQIYYFNVTDSIAPKWNPLPVNHSDIEYGDSFSYDVNATDLNGVIYSINNYDGNFSIDSNTGLISNATLVDLGIYELELNVTDLNGNSNLTNITITVIDGIIPTWDHNFSNFTIDYGQEFSYDVNASDRRNLTYQINDTTNFVIDNVTGLVRNNSVNLDLGNYSLKVSVTDGFNTNNASFVISIVDNIVPIINLISVPDVEYDSNTTLNVNVIENYNIDDVWVMLNGTRFNLTSTDGDSSDGLIYNVTFVSPSVGVNNFTVFANDSSNNLGNFTYSFVVTEITPPTVEILNLSSVIELGEDLFVRVNSTDLNNVVSVSFSLDEENFVLMNNESGVDISRIFNYTILSSYLNMDVVGSHKIQFNATDKYGNSNLSVSQFFYINDSTNPSIDILDLNNSVELGNDLFVRVNTSDLSNISYVTFNLDGLNISNMSFERFDSNQNSLYNLTIDSSLIDVVKSYSAKVYAVDEFNNSNVTVIQTFDVVDNTSPTLSLIEVNNPVEFNNTAIVNVTIFDLSNILNVSLDLDNGTSYLMSNISSGLSKIYSVEISNLDIGIFNFTINAIDVYNNSNVSEINFINVSDNEKPVIEFVLGNLVNLEFGENYTLKVNVTDNYAVDLVWIEFNNGSLYNLNEGGDNLNYNYSLIMPEVGEYNFIVFANDSSNNLVNLSGIFGVNDTIAPYFLNVSYDDEFEYNANLEVNVNLSELSQVLSVNLILDNGSSYLMNNLTNLDYNLVINSPYVGNRNFTINAIDKYLNNNLSQVYYFNVTDTTAPNVSGLVDNGPIELGESISINVTVIDLRLDEVNVEIGSQNYSMTQISSSNVYQFVNSSLNFGVGSYDYRIYANDSSNIINSSINSNFVIQDTISPVIFDEVVNNVEFDNDNLIIVSVNDTGIIDSVILSYDGNSSLMNLVSTDGFISIYNYTLIKPQIGNNQNVTIFVNDSSSNNVTNIYYFNVTDDTLPDVEILNFTSNVNYNENFSLNVNVTDLNLDSVFVEILELDNYSLNNIGSIYSIDNISVYDLGIGSYDFIIYANDSQGNLNDSVSSSFNVVDNINPVVDGLDYIPSVEFNQNLTIKINVSDFSNISNVNLILSNGSVYSMINESVLGNKSTFNFTLISPVVQTYNFTINATDIYSNYNDSIIGSFNVEDNIAPTFDFVLENQFSQFGFNFSYDINATDLQTVHYYVNDTNNFVIDEFSGLIKNLTSLNLGNYSLNVTATDGKNNVSDVFVVSVVDNLSAKLSDIVVPLTVFNNETFNVSFTAFDYDNNLSANISLDDGVNVTNYIMNGTSVSLYEKHFYYTFSNLTNGSYNVRFNVKDSSGNSNDSVIRILNVVLSNVGPQIVEFTPVNGINISEGERLSVFVNGTDDSSVPLVNLSVNGNLVLSSSSGSLNYSIILNNTAAGVYNYTACVTDGIESSCQTNIYTVIDTPVPDLRNVSPTGIVYASSQRIVIYPDREIDVGSVVLVVNGIDVTGDVNVTADNITYDASNLPEGINTVNVTAEDLVGNTQSYNWTFNVDLTSVVSGYVLNSLGNGVGSANVAVSYAQNGTLVGSTNTFVSGSWINDFTLKEGVYTFTVTAPNYVTNITNISIDGLDKSINFTLIEKPNIRVSTLSHIPAFEVEYQDIVFTAGLLYDGKFDDTVNVSLYRNDIYVTSKEVSIVKENATYSVELIWENASVGNYDFKVNVSGLSRETYLNDNEAYEFDVNVVPIEDVLSLGIRGVPGFALPANNYTFNIYTDVISSSSVDLYNIPLELIMGPGITLNTASDNVIFNIDAGDKVNNTWNIHFIINSTNTGIDISNVTASIYGDIVTTKNITAQGGLWLN